MADPTVPVGVLKPPVTFLGQLIDWHLEATQSGQRELAAETGISRPSLSRARLHLGHASAEFCKRLAPTLRLPESVIHAASSVLALRIDIEEKPLLVIPSPQEHQARSTPPVVVLEEDVATILSIMEGWDFKNGGIKFDAHLLKGALSPLQELLAEKGWSLRPSPASRGGMTHLFLSPLEPLK